MCFVTGGYIKYWWGFITYSRVWVGGGVGVGVHNVLECGGGVHNVLEGGGGVHNVLDGVGGGGGGGS